MTDAHTHSDDDLACIELVEIIGDYLEGVLPQAEVRRLTAHLGFCDGCSAYLEQVRAIAGSLGNLPQATLPTARRGALLAQFRARP